MFVKLIQFTYRDYTAFITYRAVTNSYATFMLPMPDGHRCPVVITDPAIIAEFNLACRSRFNADDMFQSVLNKHFANVTFPQPHRRVLCHAS